MFRCLVCVVVVLLRWLLFGCGGCVRVVARGCLGLVGCGVLRRADVVRMVWVDVCGG